MDSLGALLSALTLGLILTKFENIFGMPPKVLYFLSFMAGMFSIYSFLCFFLYKTKNWRPYMKIIGMANLVYCAVTIVLIIYLYHKLTVLGLGYFIFEMSVIIVLGVLELKTAFNRNVAR